MAAAHYLARAARNPLTEPLPAPSISATLFCAFAAEAYVNVALIRVLGKEEYEALDKVPVRSKYFLASRLGAREEWFSRGEQTLDDLSQLFKQRNRLVHARPEILVFGPEVERDAPELHTDLRNVARWLAATSDAASRLGRSHAELTEFERVPGRLVELEPMLRAFEAEKHGPALDRHVRALMKSLLREDNEDFLDDDELRELLEHQEPDWDVPG